VKAEGEQASARQQFPETRISLRGRRRGRGTNCCRCNARRNWIAGADFQERRLVGGRTVLDVDAAASTAVDARRRDEIAPPPGGTRCRDDELSREKYANPIGPDPRGPSSASRKAVYRNEYFSIPRPRLDSRVSARVSAHARPRLYDPVN